ncbi:MAG TPA: hypothetical protein VGY56_20645 [Verrucomicrobiae bacterium]|nr:hypothetical protein [Verrucomicrobiae bacterium]
MKKLIELLARIQAAEKEAAEFDSLESKTRADILSIAKSDVPINIQKQKITDARLTLDLVDAKRDKILEPLAQLREELHTEFFSAVGAWNATVAGIKKAMVDGLIRNSLHLFGGDVAYCRQFFPDWKIEELPVCHTYRQAFYDSSGLEQIYRRNPLPTVQGFVRHVEKFVPVLNLDPKKFE